MKRVAIACAGAGALLFASRSAEAQIVITPGGGRADVEDSPRSKGISQGRNSIKLFDTWNTERSYVLEMGPIWHRQIQDETPAQRVTGFERGAPLAGEVSLGMVLKTPYKPFFLVGQQKTLLRVVDDKSFSWSIFHQEVGAGLMIGPFEPEVRLGLSVLSADIVHAEPSIQLFSPRVGAGVGVKLGKIRLDIQAHSEYLWRWFGPDYLIRGVTLGFRLEIPRPKGPLSE